MTESLSDDEALLRELGVTLESEKPRSYTPLEARLIAGFEDILRFHNEHGRAPCHGRDRDIFERLYAVRLDRLRENESARELLADMDKPNLLSAESGEGAALDDLDDEALLEALGVRQEEDITALRHVAPVAHRRAAEEVAGREICRDFETFQPLFENVRADLKTGMRETRRAARQEDIEVGGTFIVNGQLAYVAEKGQPIEQGGRTDARLRVIYDNGTESDLLMRSLQRALHKDERGRTVTSPSAGPLFADVEDNETGTIYVLRSLSELPSIAPIRDAIVKIGVTGGSVKSRIANAEKDATYLLGRVEVMDEYTLYNVNRKKLEKMLQTIFQDAQLQIEIPDRFGNAVRPREWFFVTRGAVAKAVDLIKTQKIQDFVYDREAADFRRIDK